MFNKFLRELRHRRVLRTALAYAIVAASVVELTDIVTPALGLPQGLLRGVIITALVGFPVVIVLAWFFDLSSGGVVRGRSAPPPSSRPSTQMVSVLLIALLASAVVYLSYRLNSEAPDIPGFERGKSIAVLPFSSISAQEESETAYFSEGVAEEILNALSKVDGLRVAARTSSFTFREYDVREVGEALNVSVVLQGTVRRAGDQLRISAQLVDAQSGFQLWSDVYKHELRDVFRIQEEIAQAIVKALRLELLSDSDQRLVSPGTDSPEAYDKYLAGRNALQARTPVAAQQAVAIFEEALLLDPDYAQAYTGLADSWIVLREVGNLSLLHATQQSHAAITKALQLDVDLPEAQASLGLCILGGGDMVDAGRQFQKAIDLDPEYSDAYLLQANLLRDQGYLAAATPVYTQGLALDPYNPAMLENLALLLAFQGRFDDAIEQLDAAQTREPGRLTATLVAAQVWFLAGDQQKSLEYARQAVELASESPVALAALVDGLVRLGSPDKAGTVFDRMNETAPENETAIIASMRFYLTTGDYEALNSLAGARVQPFIDTPGWSGTQALFERVSWAATARLALGDVGGALQLLEAGTRGLDRFDPRPATIRSLALLTHARRLNGDLKGATKNAARANQLLQRALTEGWSGNQMDYLQAILAASTGETTAALEHLQNAVKAGWSDFVFANHDPLMMEIVKLPEFRDVWDIWGQDI